MQGSQADLDGQNCNGAAADAGLRADLDLEEQGPEVEDGGVVVQHLPLHLHKGLAQGLLGTAVPFLHCWPCLWSCSPAWARTCIVIGAAVVSNYGKTRPLSPTTQLVCSSAADAVLRSCGTRALWALQAALTVWPVLGVASLLADMTNAATAHVFALFHPGHRQFQSAETLFLEDACRSKSTQGYSTVQRTSVHAEGGHTCAAVAEYHRVC